jgi:hypothetical protein
VQWQKRVLTYQDDLATTPVWPLEVGEQEADEAEEVRAAWIRLWSLGVRKPCGNRRKKGQPLAGAASSEHPAMGAMW